MSQLRQLPEYKQIPREIHKSTLSKKKLCKIIRIIHRANKEGSSKQFFGLLQSLGGGGDNCKHIATAKSLPKKFIRIVKPSRKLYHGRSVTKSAGVWESAKDLRKIMWWAVEKITPLMYASTSIKGRSLDSFYRWDVYEASVKKPTRFLVISKESIQYFLENTEISNLKCEGKTVGKWLKKAFPVKKGKLKRRSHIDSDRKMATCLCNHLSCVGYIADEIDVVDGPGKLHKEVLVCVPENTLRLVQYMSFSTKKGQRSVERYLNETTTKLLPDILKKYN